MPTKQNQVNMGGLTIICDRLITGKNSRAKGEYTVSSSLASGFISDKINVINHTSGATRTLTAEESGSLVVANKADGVIFTLPVLSSDNVGIYYDFEVDTTITSNAFKISTGTQGTEFFNGTLVVMDSDGTVTSGAVFAGNGTTHDNISMNGSTTGGVMGTRLRVTATSTTTWKVSGYYVGAGSVVTPFATT